MTQSEVRWQLDNWEHYITSKKDIWNFIMKEVAMHQRSRLIKLLLKIQLKEFVK